jgi:hypothetical protein
LQSEAVKVLTAFYGGFGKLDWGSLALGLRGDIILWHHLAGMDVLSSVSKIQSRKVFCSNWEDLLTPQWEYK